MLSLAVAAALLTPDAQAAGKTWYVDDDYAQCPDANFSTIQQAINNATDDDVIIVCDGTYYESINITKPLTIRSVNGPGVTFIDGGGADTAVGVNASGVTFGGDGQGFNVSNASIGISMHTGASGVGDVDMSGISIVGNVIHGCWSDGIQVDNEGNNTDIYGITLLNNTVYNCEWGMFIDNDEAGDVRDNTIEGNVVYDCDFGIQFENSENSGHVYGNDVLGNTVYDCYEGIIFDNDESNGSIYDNEVLGNTVYDCGGSGISFENHGEGDTDDNTVADNEVWDCWSGIEFHADHQYNGSISGSTVFNNTVHHCVWGIFLYEEQWGDGSGDISGNTVEGNTVHNCSDAGVALMSWAAPSVVNNSVLNNTVYGCYDDEPSEMEDFSAGILLFSGFSGNVSGNTIEGNEVYDSWTGIYGWSLYCGNLSDNTIAGNTVHHTIWGIALNASRCLGGSPFTGTGMGSLAAEASGDEGRHRLPAMGGMGFPSVARGDGIDGWSAAGDEGIVGEEFGRPPWLPFDIGVYDNAIAGNEVYDYAAFGIGLLAVEDGLSYGNTVEGNTVYNASEEFESPSGIALGTMGGLMTNTTVAHNTVYDGYLGIGLMNLGPGGIGYSTVEGNRVWWHEVCIGLINEGGALITEIDVRDNVLYNRSFANASGGWQSGDGMGLIGCGNISVHNNSMAYSFDMGLWIEDSWNVSVTSNRIFNNSEGIYLDSVDDVWILRNDILNNSGGPLTGIYIANSSPNSWDIEIHCNNIVGNGDGVYNADDWDAVCATYNWWGDPDGPDGDGPGGGDAVFDAEYAPWLTAPVTTDLSGLALNATAVPAVVSVYDWEDLFGDMEQNIYTLGPSYTDIIVEVDCNLSEGICGLCDATVNLSSLLLQILPAGFEEDYVSGWSGEGQDIWDEWMDDLSAVEMDFEDHSNGVTLCFVDYELWLEYLFFWDEEHSIGDIALEIYFTEEYPDGYERLMALIFGELRLGQVQVPVDLWPCGGEPVTVYVPLTVADFQLPLDEGWNLRSAPLKLDSDWDTIGDVYAMGDGLNGLEAFITWDSEAGMWVEPGPAAALNPWYAYYIKMTERDQMGFIVDRAGPPPLTDKRQLHVGWNLVGMVPDFTYDNDSMPEAHPFPAMDPWQALITAGGNWSQAICTPEDLWYMENFSYRWTELDKPWYEKYFYQDMFTVYPNGSGSWSEPPFVSPGGGFWVYMDNAAMLEAIRYTPLPWELCLEEPEPEP